MSTTASWPLSAARAHRLARGRHRGRSVGELARDARGRKALAALARYGDGDGDGGDRAAAAVVSAIGDPEDWRRA